MWEKLRRMTWKPSPRSSLWPTNVPELPRVVHGTRHHRPELPRWVARVPSPRAATRRRRRRIVATRGRSLLLRSSQLRLGAGTSAASAHGHREATVGHALCTPIVSTAPRNAARSSSSRSVSASGASRLPRMASRLVADLARRRSTKVTGLWENGTSGISHLRGSSRTFSLETPTPPQEVARDVRRELGAHLPQEHQVPAPRGPFGGPRGPEGCSTSAVEEHHYLLRGIRLPRKHGRGRYTIAHHCLCHRQHAAAPCSG
jgi:hypothetical protein